MAGKSEASAAYRYGAGLSYELETTFCQAQPVVYNSGVITTCRGLIMAGDGDGDGNGGRAVVPPLADIVNLADLFATRCKLEHHGEYFRLIFSTDQTSLNGTAVTELIPSARIVMPPSGLMELAEAIMAFYVRRA